MSPLYDQLDLHDEFFENFNSPHTRMNYRLDIGQFFDFLFQNYPSAKRFKDIERLHIIKYRNLLQSDQSGLDQPMAPKTIARKLSSISSFFHYLVERNLLDANPAISVKRPRREVKTPTRALKGEEVLRLLDAINPKSNSGPLHKALLLTFFTTGLRKSEVLKLKFKNYKTLGKYKILEFSAKGGKLGQKVLHHTCIEAIEDYLRWMDSVDRAHAPNDWLFQPTRNRKNPHHLNKSLNPKTINEILDHYSKKIALGFKVTPHSARATFITQLLSQGSDIYSVAQEVGHSSVTTTQEYDKRRRKIDESPVHKLKYGT